MKILYGVQGTGNGHLTRARCLSRAFTERNVQVDYVFSGRDRDGYFSMEAFKNRTFMTGFTFATRNNKIDHLGTVRGLKIGQFVKDIKRLPVTDYDLVISDYEPVTAWRAKLTGTPILGIGHQYAFRSKAPRPRMDIAGSVLLRHFAPAEHTLGVHWHHFGGSVLPPIIDTTLKREEVIPNRYVVYLPFDDPKRIARLLKQIPEAQFVIYSPQVSVCCQNNNVTIRKTQQEAFRKELLTASGVITSCGFGLVSESLHIGLPLLAVPVAGQIEQLANAEALKMLDLAETVSTLTVENVTEFVARPKPTQRQNYPDVASAVVDHLLGDDWQNTQSLVARTWAQVENHPRLPGIAAPATV